MVCLCRCCRTWLLILGMSGLIILFWFVANSVALRYLVSVVYVLIFLRAYSHLAA